MGSRFFPHRGHRPRSRPALEVLEGRDCPAVTVTLADGILTVVGDDGPNQVGVVELGGGVVKINAVGEQFPLFAGVASIVIETFGGEDRVEYGPSSPEAASEIGDRQLTIDVGAGDDAVILRDPGPVKGPDGPEEEIAFVYHKINLGTGRDFVRAEVNHVSHVSQDVVSADGQDDLGFRFWYRPGGKVVVVPVPGAIDTTLDLGGGGNLVSLATGRAEEVDVNLKTSARAGTADPSDTDRYAFTFDWGTGMSEFRPGRLRLAADLSDADDRVRLTSRGYTDVGAEIDTAGGDDELVVSTVSLIPRRPDDPSTRLAFAARLGDGDDRLRARFVDYADAQVNLDLGIGDDRAMVHGTSNFGAAAIFPGVGVYAQLGPGDDDFRLFTRGYHEVHATLDTGPADDGQDRVAATFVLPGETDPRRRNLVTLHSCDLDRFDVLGIGYPTADITLTGHQCLVHFLGGIP